MGKLSNSLSIENFWEKMKVEPNLKKKKKRKRKKKIEKWTLYPCWIKRARFGCSTYHLVKLLNDSFECLNPLKITSLPYYLAGVLIHLNLNPAMKEKTKACG